MRLRRTRSISVVAAMIGFVLSPLFMAVAAAQEGADTNGDGVADDFDGDGMADDLDGDCIPDDFNGDGIPDGDATDFVCPEGKGGTLPTQLSLQQVARVLDYIFIRFPDVTEPGEEPDGFPNIPKLADGSPDWESLDQLLGEPGDRDLLQLPDNNINEALLEFEDINNVTFTDPVTGDQVFVATPEALEYTLGQIAKVGGDDGLIAGSGSALKGPCMGQAWSFDADGNPLDVAFDWNREQPPMKYSPDGADAPLVQAFTADDPFVVDLNGVVIYTGIAGGFPDGTGPYEHDWFMKMNFYGFAGQNIDTGGDPNSGFENRNAGSVNLYEDVPEIAKINGLMAINGKMAAPGTGNGARDDFNTIPFLCVGSGFVEFTGGTPLASVAGGAAVLLSTVGLLFNARPAKTFGGV